MGEHSRGQGETMSHRLRELGSSSLYFPTGCIYVSASPYQLYMMGEGGCTFTTAQRIPPFHHHAHSTILLLVPLNVPRCYHSSVTASDEIKFNIYIYILVNFNQIQCEMFISCQVFDPWKLISDFKLNSSILERIGSFSKMDK